MIEKKTIEGNRKLLWCCVVFAVFFIQPALLAAQTLVWRGNIPSSGRSTESISLIRGNTYFVEVSGSFYMGRWWQNNRNLLNDPCYEFNAHAQPAPMTVLENNLGINYCSRYNPGHVYRSANFVSDGRQLRFRIFDTDYRDNRGGLTAAVYLVQSAGTGGQSGSIKLFGAVGRQNSANFKANRFPDVRVNTKQWDAIPYHLNKPASFRITVPYGRKVLLSSRSDRAANIYIDNFLLFIVSDGRNNTVFSVGSVDSLSYRGQSVTRTRPIAQNISPEITNYFPVGTEVSVTVYALDYGGVGGMSDVYLLLR